MQPQLSAASMPPLLRSPSPLADSVNKLTQHMEARCTFPISVREADSAEPVLLAHYSPHSPFPPALLCCCWHGHKSAGLATWFCLQQRIPSQISWLVFSQTAQLLQLAAEPHEHQGGTGEVMGVDGEASSSPWGKQLSLLWQNKP